MPSEKERRKAEEIHRKNCEWSEGLCARNNVCIGSRTAIASALALARQEGRKKGAERVVKAVEDVIPKSVNEHDSDLVAEGKTGWNRCRNVAIDAARSEARKVGEEK